MYSGWFGIDSNRRAIEYGAAQQPYGAFAIMLIYPLTTPLGAQDWIGNLISVALASLIVSAWRELE